MATAQWPLGLICCFGLLAFLVAASIVLALIPIYLPAHTSGIQPVTNQNQVAYLQYSGTASNGVVGSPNNINSVNTQLTNQLGLSNSLIRAQSATVIRKPGTKRKRRALKNSLLRRKRQSSSFLILIEIIIIYPTTCRSRSCHDRTTSGVSTRCGERPEIVLDLIFVAITTGPIRYILIFIGFFLEIPPGFTQTNATSTIATTTVLPASGATSSTSGPSLSSSPQQTVTTTAQPQNGTTTTTTSQPQNGTTTTTTSQPQNGTTTTTSQPQNGTTTTTTTSQPQNGTTTTTTTSEPQNITTTSIPENSTTSEQENVTTTSIPENSTTSFEQTETSEMQSTGPIDFFTSEATQTMETFESTGEIIDFTTTTTAGSPSSNLTTTTTTPPVTGNLIDSNDGTDSSSTTPPGAQCNADERQGLVWISSYNLITIDYLSTTSSVDNRTVVCGSFLSDSSSEYGENAGSNLSPSTFTLRINGNIQMGHPINMQKGSLGVGTNPPHNISSSGSNGTTVDGRMVDLNGGSGTTVAADDDLSNTCQSISITLPSLSEKLSQLSNTSGNTVSLPGDQPANIEINFNAMDQNGISSINLDGNIVLNNPKTQKIIVNVDPSISEQVQAIVINILGQEITFGTSNNFGGDWLTSTNGQSKTIWNFYQTTTFTNAISNSWYGAILATNAALSNSATITGAVAVLSLTSAAAIQNSPLNVPDCI